MGDRQLEELSLPDHVFWDYWSPIPVGELAPDSVRESPDPNANHVQHVVDKLTQSLLSVERERWQDLDRASLNYISEQTVIAHLSSQLDILESQEEAYREVMTALDGIFFAKGPLETSSRFRRSMLEHQVREDEVKRRRAQPRDERFMKRIDPFDGAARSKPEMKMMYCKCGYSAADIDRYWDAQCKQIYPDDEPPEDLINELECASETCIALMSFLRKRTPHLHTGQPQLSAAVSLKNLLAENTAKFSSISLSQPTVLPASVGNVAWDVIQDVSSDNDNISFRVGAISNIEELPLSKGDVALSDSWLQIVDWDRVD